MKITKLKSAFADAMYKRLMEDDDAKVDQRIRAFYSYILVVTGRSSCSKPNLQQIPQHGDLAKYIKRQFIAENGKILIKTDYSAHEVKNWGVIANDRKLFEMFQQGFEARRDIRIAFTTDVGTLDRFAEFAKKIDWFGKDTKAETKLKALKKIRETDKRLYKLGIAYIELEVKGDIHKLNYEFFFGVPANEVNKEQRQSVKAVVFGVIYGKGPGSLSEDINDTVKQAKKLIKTLMTKFRAGGDWLNDTKEFGKLNYHVISPLGRVRHLWGYMHFDQGVIARNDRQGPNSVIQGLASDEGYLGGRELQKLQWVLFERKGQPYYLSHNNSVHDSAENESWITELPIACYLIEHAYTTQVHKVCRETFGFKVGSPFEIDFDFGGSMSKLKGWDWTKKGMMDIASSSIDWMNKELEYKLNKDKLMQVLVHNADITLALRQQELKLDREEGVMVSERMLMTPENSLKLGLRFHDEFSKSKQRDTRRGEKLLARQTWLEAA
jgi:hypothetical protein